LRASIFIKIFIANPAHCRNKSSKTIHMKRVYAYVIGTAIISSSLFISQGCTKETDTDEDLVGNWKRIDDFEGLARSEAVSFPTDLKISGSIIHRFTIGRKKPVYPEMQGILL
jgi:hypothetical protein